MIGQNRTIVTLANSGSAYTGSIQRLYTTGSALLDRVEFGHWRRKGTTGSEAIVSAIITDFTFVGGANGPLEGPITSFKTSANTPEILIYSNNVKL
jgi:hypothetical protein